MIIPGVHPGLWRLGAQLRGGEQVDGIAHLRVWPESVDALAISGQWVAELAPGSSDGRLARWLTNAACRIGLIPVHFAPNLQERLLSAHPLCLVADTNALYNGSLYQALRLRRDRPTVAMVPDQVYMEVQRRREAASATASEQKGDSIDMLISVARRQLPTLASRGLARIRTELGVLVHQARPPEAMVRYFGVDAGASSADEFDDGRTVAPNFQRDRLILEVVRHVRLQVPPDVPVWLLTADTILHEQAECEGFHSGFSWLPAPPAPLLVGSPHFEPRSGQAAFVPVEAFIDELLWNTKSVRLQEAGSKRSSTFTLPGQRDQLLRRQGASWPAGCTSETDATAWPAPVTTPAGANSAPRKAPSAESLVKFLLASTEADGVEQGTVFEPVRPYLTALGWCDLFGKTFRPTPRGQVLAAAWRSLRRDDAAPLRKWLAECGSDIARLPNTSAFLEALKARAGASSAVLAEALAWSERDVDSQARFLSAFGLCVRVSGRQWLAALHDPEMIAGSVETAVRSMVEEKADTGGAVRADTLFRRLLETQPVGLHDLRVALSEMRSQGRIAGGGSAPPLRKEDTVKVVSLVPRTDGGVDLETVDLGAGDFLIPGESAQTLRLVGSP